MDVLESKCVRERRAGLCSSGGTLCVLLLSSSIHPVVTQVNLQFNALIGLCLPRSTF